MSSEQSVADWNYQSNVCDETAVHYRDPPGAQFSRGEMQGLTSVDPAVQEATLERRQLELLTLAALRDAENAEAEQVQALLDAVSLAAEQVQDVRLDRMEEGPEVSTGMLVLNLFVFFALESTIAGAATSAVMQRVAAGILRSRATRRRAPELLTVAGIPGWWRYEDGRLTALGEIRVDAKAFASYSVDLDRIRREGLSSTRQQDVAAAAKTAHQFGQTSTGTSSPAAGDTASVAIRKAACDYGRSYRREASARYQHYQHLLQADVLGKKDQATLRRSCESVVALDTTALLSHGMLLFEAIIWSHLLGFSTLRSDEPLPTAVKPIVGGGGLGPPLVVNVTLPYHQLREDLRSYFRARFFETLVAPWAKCRNQRDAASEEEQDIQVSQYFARLAEKPKLPDDALDELHVERAILKPPAHK